MKFFRNKYKIVIVFFLIFFTSFLIMNNIKELFENPTSVYPISYSIPDKKIVPFIPTKTKQFATIIPGDTSTYIFKDEASYYKDYQISMFGKTKKKGGWDCLRHYEILASGCIPYFEDLEKSPASIMTHLPKQLIMEAMSSERPEEYIGPLLDYTRTYLSTKAMAKYIISKINKNVKKVLYLSTEEPVNYIRETTLIGFKELFGLDCTEHVHIPYLYTDYPRDTNKLYGKGFSYSKILDPSLRNTDFSIDQIKNKTFDLIIYGNAHTELLYFDDVKRHYDKSSIVFLCGDDEHSMEHCPAMKYGKEGYHAFIRELIH